LRPVRIGERCVQFRAKRLEFHRSLECLELVTEIAQPLQSIIDIEKSCLPSHRIISDPSVTMESEKQRIGEVLRSIHFVWRRIDEVLLQLRFLFIRETLSFCLLKSFN
jgi:hypothetical protein